MLFVRASQVIDAWLGLIRLTRKAWQTLPGDALGWVVMRGSGIRAPNRVVRVGDVTARLVEDPRLGRYLDSGLMRIHAQTVGHYVFSREPLDEKTLAHEAEHIRQWRRYGPFYLPLYFGSSGLAFARRRRPYWDNRFEVAAMRRADREHPEQR